MKHQVKRHKQVGLQINLPFASKGEIWERKLLDVSLDGQAAKREARGFAVELKWGQCDLPDTLAICAMREAEHVASREREIKLNSKRGF